MTSPTGFDGALRDGRAFRYEHCDVPDGMTLAEWRRSTCAPPRRRSRRGVLRRRTARR